eukprot:TRINITY_DN5783_c0_g1_i2.p1 TRINITY_DN5783_c0_g1~~TRINITY_DN5783_c0_g1_i2.p1  ORF type:complete len:123 (-),score=13.58 TRINITY_DN5783_c0_g1_i2:440-808(-)
MKQKISTRLVNFHKGPLLPDADFLRQIIPKSTETNGNGPQKSGCEFDFRDASDWKISSILKSKSKCTDLNTPEFHDQPKEISFQCSPLEIAAASLCRLSSTVMELEHSPVKRNFYSRRLFES